MRQDRRPIGSEVHVIFDAHAAPVRPIDPRFDCHHGTLGERALRGFRKARRFVHFESKSVSETMAEQIAQTALLNVVACESVGIPPRHSGANLLGGTLVGCPDHLIKRTLLLARSTDDDRSRDIGAVSADLRAKIQQQKIAALDLSRRGASVRKR